jgi:N-acetylmuramoyl-L-alanine amidase
MKVCIDPGHGMSNRRKGLFDPGAVHDEAGVTFQEADIALKYGLTLRDTFLGRGVPVFLSRDDNEDEAPVNARAARAKGQGCDVFISLHLNDFEDDAANGLEVLFNDEQDRALAEELQQALVRVTNLRNRGIKQRDNLAVLRFEGAAVLIELGFIANDRDRNTLLDVEVRNDVCSAIADTLLGKAKAIEKKLDLPLGPLGIASDYTIPLFAVPHVGPDSGVPWNKAKLAAGMNIYSGLVRNSCHVFSGDVKAVYYAAKFAIDGDGSGGNLEDDPVHQSDTSLHNADNQPLNSRRYPFIVLPLPPVESGVERLDNHGVKLGDLGVCIFRNGRVVPVLYGDKGPRRKIGEGSMLAASQLGINPDPNIGGIDATEIPPGIVHVVFPGSNDVKGGKTNRTADDVVGDALQRFDQFRGKA